ncbi:AAA family ATPase [Sphingobacterium faecium]|jgi:NadR type nicotinamide-nucleotide adenylyltransferase|uniref:AAA family ATPase n=1 Tax=Sphingobacterium faecium TaxID=34087 RepID=UPI0004E5F4E5|nr:ATP-binding protein [Sphingobacterium faecium]UXD68688.1 ATP-binding protein [Sphingobacterium faecium]WGQ16400.1 ATP-binding protein [Sphingobacterium faecium]CDS95691.1 NadR family protein [Sphingobacterium sp. PM2-P1-29]SJN29708.1 Ribosylnicotinamide kinase [Sphingobacterium faecium PCAi_F2.5]
MSTSNPDLIKIAVVGPESTGKSTIAQAVARHFDTVCVPEYAREYCKNLHNEYTLQDEVNMYYGQIALENTLIPLAKNNLLICDTTIMTIKIWCDYLFGDTPQDVKEEINNRHYDLYLLMDIDLPWEEDPLRDFPEHREHFMGVWESELKSLKANYIIISGLGDERLKNALEATNRK